MWPIVYTPLGWLKALAAMLMLRADAQSWRNRWFGAAEASA